MPGVNYYCGFYNIYLRPDIIIDTPAFAASKILKT